MTADRKSLPIVFGPVLDKNVEQLKILNTAIFPVRYKVPPPPQRIVIVASTCMSPSHLITRPHLSGSHLLYTPQRLALHVLTYAPSCYRSNFTRMPVPVGQSHSLVCAILTGALSFNPIPYSYNCTSERNSTSPMLRPPPGRVAC